MEELTPELHRAMMQYPRYDGCRFEPLDEKIHGPQDPDTVGFMHVYFKGRFYIRNPQKMLRITNIGGGGSDNGRV